MRVAPILTLLALLAGADACADARPARLGLCVACHAETGNSVVAGVPHLAGQDPEYLAAALRQYRSGERTAAPMRAVAGALSEADVADLARWYALQPRCPGGATP